MSEPTSSRFGPLGDLLTRLTRWLPFPRRPGAGPAQPTAEEIARDRLRVQVGVIRKAFREDVAIAPVEGPRRPSDDADTYYLYRPRHALVRQDRRDDLDTFFERRQDVYVGGLERNTDQEPPPRTELVVLPARRDSADDVLETLAEIEAELGEGIATPDHILYVTREGRMCPATEPEMTRSTRPWPPVATDESAGTGVRIGVVDTGLWTPAVVSPVTPWMDGVVCDPSDEEFINQAAIHPYGGHGTFVAGVVQCMAPASRVEVEGVLTNGGAVYESAICRQLHEALLDGDHPQIISISAGTHTRRDMALLAFEMLAAEHGLDDGEQTIVVAAAGNDGSDERFWPAAFPWVLSVGSVDPDGKVSDFSNFGDWVDVYARGRDLVNAFPEGKYTCTEPPNKGQVRTFKGVARWSGTSFSTPLVSGLIAAHMSASKASAGTARAAVLGSGVSSTGPDGNSIRIVGPLT